MKSIEDIIIEVNKKNEKVIEYNNCFVLSELDSIIYIRTPNEHQLTFETDSYFSKERISKRFLVIKWDTKATVYEYPGAHSFERKKYFLYIDFEKESIWHCESDNRCIFYNRISKISLYNFNLEKKDSYLGWLSFSEDKMGITTRFIICLKDDTKYEIYSNTQNHYIMNILYSEYQTLHVIAISQGVPKRFCSINNVNKWSRLERSEGYYNLLFDFYIIETNESFILFNLKTLKQIRLDFKDMIPTTFEFNESYYLHKHMAKTLINLHRQFVCVDNKVFDENLNTIFDYRDNPNHRRSKITLLHTYSNYIAYKINNELRILLVAPTHKGFESKDARYVYCYYDLKRQPEIKVKDHFKSSAYNSYISSNDLLSFNPVTQRFIVDTKRIEENDKIRRKNAIDVPEHFSIWDALDGDPEAYWNID